LLAPWPGLNSGYAKLFRAVGQGLFGSFGSKGMVFFRSADSQSDALDTHILLGNRDMLQPGGRLPATTLVLSTRVFGYVPTAFVIALVLSTPLPWRRRVWALSWGLLSIHLFIAAVTALMIVHGYCENGALGLFQWDSFGKRIVDSLYQIFVVYLGALFVVPMFIWVGVTFRRGDLAKVFGLPEKPQASAPAPATASGSEASAGRKAN
jgi:hypothetical protein